VVLLRKTACQESIMDWARERDVNNPSDVHVSAFGIIEEELTAAEAVWVNRYVRPGRNFVFQVL